MLIEAEGCYTVTCDFFQRSVTFKHPHSLIIVFQEVLNPASGTSRKQACLDNRAHGADSILILQQDLLYAGLADSPCRLVDDTGKGDLITGIQKEGEKSEDVFHFLTLIETQCSDKLVFYPETHENLLEST